MVISKEAHDEAVRRLGSADPDTVTSEQRELAEKVAAEFILLGAIVISEVPAGRDRSVALTELENAKMRAIRAIMVPAGVGEVSS